ncbi:hypothetical protein DSM104299_03932 [Baekduia alba]|uniref:DUF7144 family membrane protein n=1 Tax=Baekduia alba TaxID=2997333 RepID=UPI002341CF84|nr:DUF308 domain-containing protein [Baekduia alba]WCB95189.1 hypothetical protein DSM104299_03932 [Baekduia alba]
MPRNVLTTDQLPPARDRFADPSTYSAVDEGPGWLAFAGAMLAIVGVLNVIYGIAATSNAKFFVRDVEYVFGNLSTWGWFMIVLGVTQILAAFSVWANRQFGRWFGVVVAGGNAIVQMIAIPSYPFLALSLFAIDIIVIWALLTYGGRRAEVA